MLPVRNVSLRCAVALSVVLLPRLAAAQLSPGPAAPMPSAGPGSPYPSPPPIAPSSAPARPTYAPSPGTYPPSPISPPPSTYPPSPAYPPTSGSYPPSSYPPSPTYPAPSTYPPSSTPPTPPYSPYGAQPAAPASNGWYMPGSAPPPVSTPSLPSAPPAASDAAPDFHWSLGAGIGLGSPSAFAGSLYYGIESPPSLISPRVSIETRVGANSWLVLSASGAFASFEEPVTSSTSQPSAEHKTLAVSTTRLAALIGLRQIVARGFVDLSLSIAGGVSRERAGGDAPQGTEKVSPIVPGSSATTVGALAGLVVEKELLRGLALRLSTDVLGANYGIVNHVDWLDGVATYTTYTSGSLGLTLSPALQAMFYF